MTDQALHDPTVERAEPDEARPVGLLWEGDAGTLREPARRALVQLLRGPYLSAGRQGHLWNALLNDEAPIRSRLADLFLDLVVDHDAQIAFVRNTEPDGVETPKVVRSAPLTFMDTAMLLHLRQQLLQGAPGERMIVGADEVADELQVYRGKDTSDPALFGKRIAASWRKLEQYGILARTSTEGRFEISPVLRLVFGAEEIAAVRAEYERLASGPPDPADPAAGSVDDGSADDGAQVYGDAQVDDTSEGDL